MKNKATISTPEEKRKALLKKVGRPTPGMKQALTDAFGLLQDEDMKGFDQDAYKEKAWRK